MSDVSQAPNTNGLVPWAARLALVSGIVSGIGVVLLLVMIVQFALGKEELGLAFGRLNDISAVIQYLLAIPLAWALYRILLPYNPVLVRIATAVGWVAMAAVIVLQWLLVVGAMTFEQQAGWVSLALVVGVGSWLVMTGLVAQSTGKFPRALLMSILAAVYFGYPVWAFWLARRLRAW